MKYKCISCGNEWSIENMAPVCPHCYDALKARLSKSEAVVEDYRRVMDLVGDEDQKIMAEYFATFDEKEKP